MQIILTANGLYFFGKAKDFRPWLSALAAEPATLADYLRLRLN